MNVTKGLIYILELSTMERLEMQFVPDTVTDNRAASYGEVQVVGRNNPHYHFGGGSDTLSFTIDFHVSEENRADVVRKCRWLKSLAYADGSSKAPPRVKLIFGDLYRDDEWIVTSVSTNYSLFDTNNNMMPKQAYVDISLSLDPSRNLKWRDVKR